MKKLPNCLRMADGGDAAGVLTRWANRLVGNNPAAMKARGRSEEADAPPYVPPQQPVAKPGLRFMDGGALELGGMFNGASNQFGSSQALKAPAAVDPAAGAARRSNMLAAAGRVQSYSPMMQMPGSLQMADGGIFGMFKRKTGNERFAEHQAKVAAEAAAPAVAASAPAPAIVPNQVNVLKRREAAAGLRDGGDLRTGHGGNVPGTGEGDKIPAKYEPGEFVVSNDMLDRAPGLRDELTQLRKETLHSQGKTVEEADAAALGYDGDSQEESQHEVPADAQMDETLAGDGVVSGRGRVRGSEGNRGGRLELRAEMGIGDWSRLTDSEIGKGRQVAEDYKALRDATARSVVGDARAAIQQPPGEAARYASSPPRPAPQGFSGPHGDGTYGANSHAQTPQASSAVNKSPGVGGALKNVLSPLAKAGAAGLRAFGAPATAAASIYDGLNTDTEDYAKRFGMEHTQPGAWRDVGVRALGVASDVGNNLTLGGAKRFLYRDGESKQSLVPEQMRSPMEQSAPSSLRLPAAPTTQPSFRAPDAGTRSLREGRSGAEEGVVTRKGNSFSGTNVSNYGNQSVVPGMDKALIEQTLTNPDGSRWSAADNSRMAANLRDGQDPYRGTSRAPARDPLAEATAEPYGTPGRKSRIAAAQALRSDDTLRRGQDGDAVRAAMTARTARESGARDQFNKDRDNELAERKFGSELASSEQTRSKYARDNLANELKVFGPDKKVDEAGSAFAMEMVQKVLPGADQLTGEALSKNLPEMKALAGVFGRLYKNPQMGIAKINPFDPRAPAQDALPNLKGGKLLRDGIIGGLVTPGSGVGNYYIELGGVKTPLGKDLSEREIEILRHAMDTGNWPNAPQKTQKGK